MKEEGPTLKTGPNGPPVTVLEWSSGKEPRQPGKLSGRWLGVVVTMFGHSSVSLTSIARGNINFVTFLWEQPKTVLKSSSREWRLLATMTFGYMASERLRWPAWKMVGRCSNPVGSLATLKITSTEDGPSMSMDLVFQVYPTCFFLNILLQLSIWNFSGKEHWLGLNNIYDMTQEKFYQLRVTLKDFQRDTGVAFYDNFYLVNRVCIEVRSLLKQSITNLYL